MCNAIPTDQGDTATRGVLWKVLRPSTTCLPILYLCPVWCDIVSVHIHCNCGCVMDVPSHMPALSTLYKRWNKCSVMVIKRSASLSLKSLTGAQNITKWTTAPQTSMEELTALPDVPWLDLGERPPEKERERGGIIKILI